MKKLAVQHMQKTFDNRIVVDDISLEVNAGEVIGLLGPNGAGKTTTFLSILGIVRPERGEVLLNDQDITYLPVYQRARLGIGFLPQEPSVFKGLSVWENLLAVLQMRRQKMLSNPEILLTEMGLQELRDRKAYLLSGGERRRLEIARSLLLQPDFLLLDEPFAGIDPIQIAELQHIIRTLHRKQLGIIITDHNVREILRITNRSYIIHQGRVIFTGSSADLINDEQVQKEYLGKEFRWN